MAVCILFATRVETSDLESHGNLGKNFKFFYKLNAQLLCHSVMVGRITIGTMGPPPLPDLMATVDTKRTSRDRNGRCRSNQYGLSIVQRDRLPCPGVLRRGILYAPPFDRRPLID